MAFFLFAGGERGIGGVVGVPGGAVKLAELWPVTPGGVRNACARVRAIRRLLGARGMGLGTSPVVPKPARDPTLGVTSEASA